MKPDYNLCDICGERADADAHFFIVVGSQPDPAGGPSQDVGEDVDLCGRCLIRALKRLLRAVGTPHYQAFLTNEQRQEFLSWVRKA